MGLRHVGTGLRLLARLQQQPHELVSARGGAGGTAGGRVSGTLAREQEEEREEVQRSVSLLCTRVCEAALQQAQADEVSQAELVDALSAVLALRAGLTR